MWDHAVADTREGFRMSSGPIDDVWLVPAYTGQPRLHYIEKKQAEPGLPLRFGFA